MKKDQQKLDIADSASNADLKSIIHQHALFFDKLIDLIPARFYLPNDEDKPWFQGLSKAQKAAAKQESRENIKKARKDRLDPEKSSATTLDLLKQSIEKKKFKEENDDGDETGLKSMVSGLEDDERSVTYEELRQRLRRKIEEFRANRNNGDSGKDNKKRNERSGKNAMQQKKRKRDDDSEEKKTASSASANKVEKDVEEASKELAFSKVKLENEEEKGKKKKKKLSKFKELKIAQELEDAKKNPEKSDVISKHSWKAATSRAAGMKVHDNPKLLKESIKKGKKRHQKNAQKWKERAETTDKMKAEKQKTRAENIAERIHQKKMRRIEKREKKLLRPGFEGRKEGFINEGSA